MTDASNRDLVFRTWQKKDGAYTHTYVTIARKHREQIAQIREEAVDNRAGYGSDDAARYWVDACNQMIGDGHASVYRSTSEGVSITIRWQHYGETGYCSPDFENVGREFREIENATKLLRHLGSKIERMRLREQIKLGTHSSSDTPREISSWTFEDPARLLAALRATKDAVEVEEIRVGPQTWHTVDVPKRQRPAREYTLANAHSPGMQVSA